MNSAPMVRQDAGDGSTQFGVVNGSVYNIFQAGSGASDAPIDMQLYLGGVLSRPEFSQKFLPLDIEPFAFVAGQGFQSRHEPGQPLMSSIAAHRHLLLLGNAGAGKTASLRHAAAVLSRSVAQGAQAAGTLDGVMPIYVELSRFRVIPGMAPLTSILALIAESLHAALLIEQLPSEKAVHRLLLGERVILLLDGLNEAPADAREVCVRGIQDLAAKYGGIRIVVGTRFFRAEELHDWHAVALQELQDAQIVEFLGQQLGETQGGQIAAEIVASDLGLLRLPLFLRFIMELARVSGTAASFVNGSRSFMVGRYAKYLMTRDAHSGASRGQEQLATTAELETILVTLGNVCRRAGQSIPLIDACRIVQDEARIAEVRAEQILTQLCQMGLLYRDGEYVRFWHQTLQDYYYSLHLARSHLRRGAGRIPSGLKQIIRTSKEDEGCAYLLAHVDSDEQLGPLLEYAAIKNAPLCFAWVDDLRFEGRAAEAAAGAMAVVRRRMRRSRRYSRISGSRAVMIRMALYPFGLLAPALLQAVSLADWTAVIASAVLVVWSVWIMDVVAHYGGTDDLLHLGLAAVTMRHSATRQDVGQALAELSTSVLSSAAVRKIAQETVSARGGTGELDRLMSVLPVYTGIPFLVGLEDPRVVGMLARLVKLNNSYSCEAVRCLGVRYGKFPQERPVIRAIWAGALETIRPRWKLWQLARRQLTRSGARRRGGFGVLAYRVRSFALGLLALLLVAAASGGLLVGFDELNGLLLGGRGGTWYQALADCALVYAIPLLVPVFLSGAAAGLVGFGDYPVGPFSFAGVILMAGLLPVLLWVDTARMGAVGIGGCHTLAGLKPWQIAVLSLCCPGIMALLYPSLRPLIRRNAVPVSWEALIGHDASAVSPSVSRASG
jgi:hypothetical protein